jgi:protein phosphatase-4 regulatory subunit 3
VRIEDESIKRKIHYTYRLQYLKDVVLARILDDPTFGVLNSLIFFHQVDIVQHLQGNGPFLKELFGIFSSKEQNLLRKKDAVLFIQQCCAIAKSLPANGRAQLYQNFISSGLLEVIQSALKHQDASVRVAGTDILVALIDHDALMVRSYIFKAIQEKSKPLTDTLIELLLIEVDLGVKAQMADAIKILLDPNANSASIEALGRTNSDFLAKMRGQLPSVPQTDSFIQNFYDESARKLFQPLKELEGRESSKCEPPPCGFKTNMVQWKIYPCRRCHCTLIWWKYCVSSSASTHSAASTSSCRKAWRCGLPSSWVARRNT